MYDLDERGCISAESCTVSIDSRPLPMHYTLCSISESASNGPSLDILPVCLQLPSIKGYTGDGTKVSQLLCKKYIMSAF